MPPPALPVADSGAGTGTGYALGWPHYIRVRLEKVTSFIKKCMIFFMPCKTQKKQGLIRLHIFDFSSIMAAQDFMYPLLSPDFP